MVWTRACSRPPLPAGAPTHGSRDAMAAHDGPRRLDGDAVLLGRDALGTSLRGTA